MAISLQYSYNCSTLLLIVLSLFLWLTYKLSFSTCTYGKKHSICRVWYYPSFQASTGSWLVSPMDKWGLLTRLNIPTSLIGPQIHDPEVTLCISSGSCISVFCTSKNNLCDPGYFVPLLCPLLRLLILFKQDQCFTCVLIKFLSILQVLFITHSIMWTIKCCSSLWQLQIWEMRFDIIRVIHKSVRRTCAGVRHSAQDGTAISLYSTAWDSAESKSGCHQLLSQNSQSHCYIIESAVMSWTQICFCVCDNLPWVLILPSVAVGHPCST